MFFGVQCTRVQCHARRAAYSANAPCCIINHHTLEQSVFAPAACRSAVTLVLAFKLVCAVRLEPHLPTADPRLARARLSLVFCRCRQSHACLFSSCPRTAPPTAPAPASEPLWPRPKYSSSSASVPAAADNTPRDRPLARP